MQLNFDKYQGLGNDFIVVEVADPTEVTTERAIALCDRHFGIGADGVLLVSPASSAAARATMTVINSDGSRPEMCGNGLRCVALHLARDQVDDSFVVDTDAGPRQCDVSLDQAEPVRQASIRTGMGRAVVQGSLEHLVGGAVQKFALVSMGNPHAISFQAPVSTAELDAVGPAVSARLPGGSNVEIATVQPDGSLQVAVWERGVGRTLACGTGAAATAVAAIGASLADGSQPITVRLPGGALTVSVNGELEVSLTGPARWVYRGSTIVD